MVEMELSWEDVTASAEDRQKCCQCVDQYIMDLE